MPERINTRIVSSDRYELTAERMKEIAPDHRAEARSIARTVEIHRFRYRVGKEEYVGFIGRPRRTRKELPAINFNRGGNHDYGLLGPVALFGRFGKMASWGYTVIGSQYPGSDGGTGKHEFGGRDLNSVLALREILRRDPRADIGRIGMYGTSRGTIMTFLALTKVDWIKAAVVQGAPPDLEAFAEYRPEMLSEVFKRYFPVTIAEMRKRSPYRFAHRIRKDVPLLILHGTADAACRVREVLTFSQRLNDLNHPHRLVVFEGGDHGLWTHWEEHHRMIRDWFDATLK